MFFALSIFIVMYIFLLALPKYRSYTAVITAVLFIVLGILPVKNALTAINYNVIMMLTGTMLIVELFIESDMPSYMAENLLKIVPNVQWAVVLLSLFAGIISAFVDNVATVLMVAPVGIEVCKKIKTNPVPVIISIAVSSNLQGAATLVGDATSILLGSYADLSFNDFFWFNGKPGICFAVELGALLTIPVILFLFRHEKGKVNEEVTVKITDYTPTYFLIGMIISLIVASQFENKPELTNGFICCGLALILIVIEAIKQKNIKVIPNTIITLDIETLLLLCGLFVVIEGITEAGVIEKIVEIFMNAGGDNVFVMYTLIVFVSVLVSAFIDNIPYVATMLPVVTGIAAMMGISPYLFDFGLLIGATLGGNITPVGASANIAGIGILRKNGYEVKNSDFFRIGIPFTLVAVLSGYLFLWFVWA
ncbi:MAG: SLC13 family permease [Bulleidia sp.]|nr:arsenic transporter [Erysipelotrichaceae bacterium]MDY2780799.1 SLC13 family permease [Bulleidia sp.]